MLVLKYLLLFFFFRQGHLSKASSSEWLKVLQYIPCVQIALYALLHLDKIFIRNMHTPLKNITFPISSYVSQNTIPLLYILKYYRPIVIGRQLVSDWLFSDFSLVAILCLSLENRKQLFNIPIKFVLLVASFLQCRGFEHEIWQL